MDTKELFERLAKVDDEHFAVVEKGCVEIYSKEEFISTPTMQTPQSPPKPTRWRANKWGKFYSVSTFGIVQGCRDDYSSTYDYLYYTHNYFETEGEAETYARVLETEMLLMKFACEHNESGDSCKVVGIKQYSLYEYDKQVFTMYNTNCKEGRIIYFDSTSLANEAIEEIGEDRVKEYLTYEW